VDVKTLSRPRRWLLEQCRRINFGKITFAVRGGQPDPDAPCRVTRTLKLNGGGTNGPAPDNAGGRFELRKEYVALFHHLGRLPDGTRVSVKLMYGLPKTAIDVEEPGLAG
jgi:hypothetical protein